MQNIVANVELFFSFLIFTKEKMLQKRMSLEVINDFFIIIRAVPKVLKDYEEMKMDLPTNILPNYTIISSTYNKQY